MPRGTHTGGDSDRGEVGELARVESSAMVRRWTRIDTQEMGERVRSRRKVALACAMMKIRA